MYGVWANALLTKPLLSCNSSIYKTQHVYPKEKQQPFTSYKTTWISSSQKNKSMRFKIKICLDDSPYRDHTSAFTLEPKEKKLFCGLRFFWTRRQFSCRQRKLHICWLVGENSLVFLRGIRCGILCNVPCIWCITVFCGKIT